MMIRLWDSYQSFSFSFEFGTLMQVRLLCADDYCWSGFGICICWVNWSSFGVYLGRKEEGAEGAQRGRP